MSHAHTIAYSDLRRALVGVDELNIWQLVELQKEVERAMLRCPADGPEAQEAEHNVLSAYHTYIGETLTERSSTT